MTETDIFIPNWIDKKFLETALKTAYCDTSIIVSSCDIKRATANGDNYLSDMFRANLKLTKDKSDEIKTISIIIKCSPQKKEFIGQLVLDLGVFEREAEIFTSVLPELYRILQNVSIKTLQPFGARSLYFKTFSKSSVIVLEDLKQQGFKMAERHFGLDYEHCLMVMKTLARLHAASVALYQKDPGYVKSFDRRPGFDNEKQRKSFHDFFIGCLKSLANEIDTWSDFQEYPERIRHLADNLKTKLFDIVQRNEDEFNVLTHGDLWVNNMMFKYCDITGKLQDIRFVDYQMCHWTTPAVDILYFLHTSPNLDLWDKHSDLIQEYHTELGDNLELFDLKHLHPSLKELQCILEKRAFYSLFSATVILPIVLLDPDNALKINDVLENDSVSDSVGDQKMHSSSQYKRAIRKILPTFSEKGLL